ncbi:MAG: DUF6599 family protein [Bryobacteraceae bacterium]|jgi:hypothetical protein
MLRSVVMSTPSALLGWAVLVSGLPAWTSVWPDQLGGCVKRASKPAALADRALWDEYGLQQAELAEYSGCANPFQVEAFRLNDSTGAMAAFEWQRPAGSRPSKLAPLSAETGNGTLLVYHNCLLRFTRWKPEAADLQPFLESLRDVSQAPLPTLKDYLPAGNLVPNSERYVLGPAGLDRFEPRIPPSVAAFHLGAEVCLAQYRTKSDPLKMAIFSYPTPQIARQRLAEFEKLTGAMAKRSGPLVAVILSPSDADEAERLLAGVRYQANITLSERAPTLRDNVGNLIINIFMLIGLLMGVFLVVGLVFGFLKRWTGWGSSEEPMILLHLEDRR